MSEQSKCDQPGAPCRQWLASQGAEPGKAAITHLRERLACFGAEIEARAADLARPKGGMIVPFHGDFASAPPSMIERLRWWHRDLLEALDAAERSRT
jgi:hypothetical protein